MTKSGQTWTKAINSFCSPELGQSIRDAEKVDRELKILNRAHTVAIFALAGLMVAYAVMQERPLSSSSPPVMQAKLDTPNP